LIHVLSQLHISLQISSIVPPLAMLSATVSNDGDDSKNVESSGTIEAPSTAFCIEVTHVANDDGTSIENEEYDSFAVNDVTGSGVLAGDGIKAIHEYDRETLDSRYSLMPSPNAA